MSEFLGEVRYSLRRLIRTPGLTLILVICLGLCIGANTAAFSFMNGLFFRALPVPDAEEIVRVYTEYESGQRWGPFSYLNYVDYRDENQVFSGLVFDMATPMNISFEGRNEQIWGSMVSENYFSVLEVSFPVGRAFESSESLAPGSNPFVVLSDSLWRQTLGGDPGVIGKSLRINDHPFTILGVAPASFTGTNLGFSPQLWVPAMMQSVIVPGADILEERGTSRLQVLGRLESGVNLEQAQEALAPITRHLVETYPDVNQGMSVALIPERQGGLHPSLRDTFLVFLSILMVVVLLVLLVACANIAGLMLARNSARHKEIALRLALGVSRRKLLRQLLTETVLLALLGGAAGLLLATWLTRLVASFNPTGLPISVEVSLDGRVLVFTLLTSFFTALVFGLLPALKATQLDLVSSLKEGSLAAGQQKSGLRRVLVVVQVALSMVLLIAAGLFVRSLSKAEFIEPGFEYEHVLTASFDLGLQGYDEPRGKAFNRQLLERIRALPGVRTASLATVVPFNLFGRGTYISPEGYEPAPDAGEPIVNYNVVTEDYFQTMNIPLLEGRDFSSQDTEDASPAAIVNQAMVERFWPGQSALGKRVMGEHRIVGVVQDSKFLSLGETPEPFLYLPSEQSYESAVILHLLCEGDPTGMVSELRSAVRALDEELPVHAVRPLSDQLSVALLPSRLGAMLLAAFGLLALLLAAVGLYGIMAFMVSQRSRELGIRMALGAAPGSIFKMVVGQGVRLAAVGAFLGLLVAVVLTRFLVSQLHGISPLDPITFGVVSVFLGLIAFLASYIPAWRAARLNPISTLRSE